jgi:hypothetical protein
MRGTLMVASDGRVPARMRQHSGDDVCEVKHRREEKDFLDAFVVATNRQQPDESAADRN